MPPKITVELYVRIAGTEIPVGSVTFTKDAETHAVTRQEQLRIARTLAMQFAQISDTK